MAGPAPLVGRTRERSALEAALERCDAGAGGVLLLSGEAGVGKTRLVESVVDSWAGEAVPTRALPGRPAYDALGAVGDVEVSAAGAAESVLRALLARSARGPTLVHVADCHHADAATIELLGRADDLLSDRPLLVVAEYRSDALPRQHALRALRGELRRRRRLVEVAVPPLSAEGSQALVSALIGRPVDGGLAANIHLRSGGVPFFIEELVHGLAESGVLDGSGSHLGSSADELPLPDTVLDAVLARTTGLRKAHGDAVDRAAVLGAQLDLAVLESLVGPSEVDALLESGLLAEYDERTAVFRHALVRDALVRSVPWARRRRLHADAAEALDRHGAHPAVVADHWDAAQEPARARHHLLLAVDQHCRVHAFRDAIAAGRRALALWPRDEDVDARLRTLEGLGDCAELSGDFALAVATWPDVALAHRQTGRFVEAGRAHRRAANAADMVGDLVASTEQRTLAAEAFEVAGARAEAAEERLALAQRLKAAGRFTRALEEVEAARDAAQASGATTVLTVARALEGATRSALGERGEGVRIAREAVEQALAERMTQVAAEAVYELGEALEYAADYAAALESYSVAVDLCREHNLEDLATLCFVCTSPVARLMGQWDRVVEVCSTVASDEGATLFARRVADEELGLVAALRGDARRARPRLRRAADFGGAQGVLGVELGAVWGLAQVATLEGDHVEVNLLLDRLVSLSAATEECHYSLPALRWASSYLAARTPGTMLARVHRVVANRSVSNAAPKVLSTLAHCAAELARSEGDLDGADELAGRSLDLLDGMTAPYEQALAGLCRARIHQARGERAAAVGELTTAYRTARLLGARPLARECVEELEAMGEQVDQRLGRLAAREGANAGLTRREAEVLHHVAEGRTNREIAASLFLSVRTVDMHVRHVLEKLGATSRAGAVRKAFDLGLVAAPEAGAQAAPAREVRQPPGENTAAPPMLSGSP